MKNLAKVLGVIERQWSARIGGGLEKLCVVNEPALVQKFLFFLSLSFSMIAAELS